MLSWPIEFNIIEDKDMYTSVNTLFFHPAEQLKYLVVWLME